MPYVVVIPLAVLHENCMTSLQPSWLPRYCSYDVLQVVPDGEANTQATQNMDEIGVCLFEDEDSCPADNQNRIWIGVTAAMK